MLIRFDHEFALPVEQVDAYFRTPADWPRLFGFAADVRELGDGWYSVPLRRFPFPLVTKYLEHRPNDRARWIFRGFWRGQGEVRLTPTPGGVRVEGHEQIAIRWLFFLSPVVERLFLERGFHAIWESGWRRLRKLEASRLPPLPS